MHGSSTWLALLGLGALHGINPAMGWLFAVALGLQRRSRGAVWGALVPLALGHALALAALVLLAVMVGLVIPSDRLRWLTAAALVGFGIYYLAWHRHAAWGGMQVGWQELTFWSFLMASSHGAGLMVLPFILGGAAPTPSRVPVDGAAALPVAHTDHLMGAGLEGIGSAMGVLATLVHTAGYLVVAGVLAVVVYEKLGLHLLRRAWVNMNLIWGAGLILTGLLTPFL
jgi:hypothetical protein